MSTQPHYRYRAAISRRLMLEPVDHPDPLEHLTVHAADAATAQCAIRHLTGAAHVFAAERLSDQPVAPRRPLRSAARILAGAGVDPDLAERLTLAPSNEHLFGIAVFA